jgi:hypothetical protein
MDVNTLLRAKQTRLQWSWYETLTSHGLEAIYALASSFHDGRFLSDKTTVPVPRLITHGPTDNPHHCAGLPFLILTPVPGKPLPFIWKELGNSVKNMIHEQIADIAMQLRLQSFDRIGGVTLDDRDALSCYAA